MNGNRIFFFALFILNFNFSLNASARAEELAHASCPSLQGDYCCGVTGGQIEACSQPMRIDQMSVEGGQSYTFKYEDQKTTIVADGKVRPMVWGRFVGDGTGGCTSNGVYVEFPNAQIRGTHAKGYYSYQVYFDADNFMNFKQTCNFVDDGVPVALPCSLETGYGCRRR